jgi:hypothetical protein
VKDNRIELNGGSSGKLMFMKVYYVIAIVLFLGCSNLQKQKNSKTYLNNFNSNKIENIPIARLCKTTELNGKIVKVEGVFYYNFEDVAIYSTNDRTEFGNAFWLDFSHEMIKHEHLLKKLNGKHVTILGILDFSRKGHLSSFCATIDSVFCIKENK